MGEVLAVCMSEKRGVSKQNRGSILIRKNWGIEGDAHAGEWHRQVSLLSAEKILEFNKKGAGIMFGAFGENIVVEGLDFRNFPVGTLLRCNEVLLELTQIGKECHNHCAIYHNVGDCIMPREGVFAKVLNGGEISVGDKMVIEERKIRKPWQVAVVTLSDKAYKGIRKDLSGSTIEKRLIDEGFEVIEKLILPDNRELIKQTLIRLTDQQQIDLILTTGGTGLGLRDVTPEATMEISTKNVPGIAEAIRMKSMKITSRAMLSRGVSVVRNRTLIINMPGSPKACKESMDAFMGILSHALSLLRDEVNECALN